MRIATWNVNSLKARLPRVEEFLGYGEVPVGICAALYVQLNAENR